jgi:hypothetical protein
MARAMGAFDVESRRFNDRTHGIVAEFTEVIIYRKRPTGVKTGSGSTAELGAGSGRLERLPGIAYSTSRAFILFLGLREHLSC